MRQAPIPYVAAFILLAGLIFAAFQWGYGRILEAKGAAISTLNMRVGALLAERDDLRRQLDNKPVAQQAPPSKPMERDPDGLYQFGRNVGTVTGVTPDPAHGVVAFRAIRATPDFNLDGDVEYRQFRLARCTSNGEGSMQFGGFVIQRTLSGVLCQISGMRE